MRYIGMARLAAAASAALVFGLAACSVPVRDGAEEAAHALWTPALTDAGLARLDARLDQYVADGDLPGGVMLILQDGQTVYERAFGWRDVEAQDRMAVDDLFRIASQTKAITSVAVMQLVEEGRLTLDTPLSDIFPEWSQIEVATRGEDGAVTTERARRRITIRDLLTHTSGVDYGYGPAREAWGEAGIYGWYFLHRDDSAADVARRMAGLPQAAQPGERFVYGYSTDILGAVVETVTGEPLDQVFRARIFEPLGMTDTDFFVAEDRRDRLAVVYAPGEARLEPAAAEPGNWVDHGQGAYADGRPTAFSGGAGLVSTARDYARFLEAMRRGGELDGARILSQPTVALMTRNHLAEGVYRSEGKGFGLGFEVLLDPGLAGEFGSEGAFGWGGAYHTRYWVDPGYGLTVVYMTQLRPTGGVDDHTVIRALVYGALQ